MRERNSLSLLSPCCPDSRSAMLPVASRFSSFRLLPLKHPSTPKYATHAARETNTSSFLLPREGWRGKAHSALPRSLRCYAPGLFRARNTNSVAADLILRFSRRMILSINAPSKLCAVRPRHAQVMRLSAACLRSSTWQGGGNPLRCILPLCRRRHAETLPVSTPSVLRGVAAFRSWAVRP